MKAWTLVKARSSATYETRHQGKETENQTCTWDHNMDYFIVSLKERNQENLENKQVNLNNFKLVGKRCEKYGRFVRIVFAVQYILVCLVCKYSDCREGLSSGSGSQGKFTNECFVLLKVLV